MPQNLNKEKFDLISDLEILKYNNYLGKPIGLLAHSILNTIELFELVKIYIHENESSKWMQNNIIRRVVDSKFCLKIYDYVFEQIKSEKYLNRLRFRKILEAAIVNLPDEYKIEYFTYFFNSEYTYEKRSAINMSLEIWSPKLQDFLIKEFENSIDYDILRILIPKVNSETLLRLFKISWRYSNSKYLKSIFYKKLKKCSIKDLEFIISTAPEFYLSLVKEDDKVQEEILLNCFNAVSELHKPFAIWNLGRLGKWNLIKPHIIDFVNNPNEKFSDFGDNIFE